MGDERVRQTRVRETRAHSAEARAAEAHYAEGDPIAFHETRIPEIPTTSYK